MTQKYGTAPVSAALDDPTSPLGAGESSALLGGDRDTTAKRATGKREGKATMVSSVSNLANTIIGSGMLTFPLAMASAGIVPGMLTCLFSGSVAVFGLYLLSLCAARAPHRRSSFFAVAQMTFPRAAVFFDAAIAAKCFGVSISYLIIIKGLMPNVVAALYHDLSSSTPPAWALSGRNWISLFMFILVPLVFLRHLDSLRHTSYVALFSVAYLVVIVITVYFNPLEGMPERGEVHLIHFTPNFISTFPVQVFAFTCSQNLFPIFNELRDNSQLRMNTVIGGAIGSATLTYEVIAVFGYLTFGSTVGANIIAMYPSTSLFIAVGQAAIVVLVLFSYPLQVHPCRNCLDKIFHAGEVKYIAPSAAEGEGEGADEDEVDADHASGEMSALKHTLLTAAIVTSGFTIAYFVDDLQLVLSFVGSTGSTTISFILPGLFYWQLTRADRNRNNALSLGALALAIYGGCVFVFWCVSISFPFLPSFFALLRIPSHTVYLSSHTLYLYSSPLRFLRSTPSPPYLIIPVLTRFRSLGFNIYQVIHPAAGGPAHFQ
ncbi:transmembrane amino acid transporter protein-domain-containing protein [Mycena haematopus]|nr:transmembrane amino acid transporter protein-domain-containing protein [Mycena haematopus]